LFLVLDLQLDVLQFDLDFSKKRLQQTSQDFNPEEE